MIKERPFTVTLVCLFLLIVGSVGLIESFSWWQDEKVQTSMAQIPVPFNFQVAVVYAYFTVMVVSAMFMFQEANWARWLYLGFGLVHLGYSYFCRPDFTPNWIETVAYPLFALLLLLPNANTWFSSDLDFVD